MKTIIIAAAALACAVLPAGAKPRTDWSRVQIKATDLGHGVWLLGWGSGDSLVLTGPDGVLLVDTSVPEMGEKIAAAVAKVSGGRPIRYIVNAHADHFGSNALLARGGAVIIAQENVRRRMVAGQYLAALNQTIPPSPPEAWPMVTYTDGLTIHLDGETVDLIHIPNAHTDNDTIIRFERADVVHIGGAYGPGGAYPFYDLSSGGSLDGVIAAEEKVLGFADADTRLIADEGEPETRSQLQTQHDAMVQVRARVQALIDQGKTEAEAIAAKPTADLDATWVRPGGFITGDVVVRTAYQSLKGLRPGGPPPAR